MKIIVRHILGTQPALDLDESFVVEFGEGYAAIAVTVRDGKIEVRSHGAPIRVEPRAANLVWVAPVPPNER